MTWELGRISLTTNAVTELHSSWFPGVKISVQNLVGIDLHQLHALIKREKVEIENKGHFGFCSLKSYKFLKRQKLRQRKERQPYRSLRRFGGKVS